MPPRCEGTASGLHEVNYRLWDKQDPGERMLICDRCSLPLGLIHERRYLVYTEVAHRIGCAWVAWPTSDVEGLGESVEGSAANWDTAERAVVDVLVGCGVISRPGWA